MELDNFKCPNHFFYLRCYILTISLVGYISLVSGNSEIKVSLSPAHIHLKTHGFCEVTCRSSEPMQQFQIKVFDVSTYRPELLENAQLEANCQPKENIGTQDDTTTCSIKLSAVYLTRDSLYAVVCRARTATTAWSYDYMSLFFSDSESNNLEITNRKISSNLHERVYVGVGFLGSICSITSRNPACYDWFSNQECNTTTRVPEVILHRKPAYNKCGTTIQSIEDTENGIYVFTLHGLKQQGLAKLEKTFVLVTVNKPPNAPKLCHEVSVDANGSTALTVTCTAYSSRPAANISWWFGEEQLPAGHIRPLVSNAWLWPYDDKKTSQQMTLTLTREHVGKKITCSVTHVVLNKPQSVTLRITEDFLPGLETSMTNEHETSTTAQPTSAPVRDEHLTGELQKQLLDVDKKLKVWFPVLLVLTLILLAIIIATVTTYCYMKGGVKYRRFKVCQGNVASTQPPCPLQNSRHTDSNLSEVSATTGVEFAEIRTSMVQRCVDKINASNNRPSSETGEKDIEVMHRNSIYVSYGDQSM